MVEKDDNRSEEEQYDDEEGDQPYQGIPPDRELITTPYEPSAKSLVDEINSKDLILNPEFQRYAVWDQPRQSRLIESLLLNIPIPVCFFAEDEDGKRVVVDGQQRLRAIEQFMAGSYKLKGLQVLPKLNGLRWADLTPRQSRIIGKRTIRCIVISEKSHPDIRFEVFERLNTGGIPLTDQELRNCIFRGALNELLFELAEGEAWLKLMRKKKPDNRMRFEELILRYFAFKEELKTYKPPLKQFLNDFMRKNKDASGGTRKTLRKDFEQAVACVSAAFGDKAFRRVKIAKDGSAHWDAAINRAVYDIQMLGLNGIPAADLSKKSEKIIDSFEQLCRKDADFQEAITKATADRTKILLRLRLFNGMLNKLGLEAPLLQDLPEE